MKYFLGIDGGGTKTAFFARGEDGSERKAIAGAMNYNFRSTEEALDSIKAGLAQMDLKPCDFAAVAVGDPSIDIEPESPSAIGFAEKLCRIFAGVPVLVRSDVFMALYALCGNGAGSLVIAGTGSIAIARDTAGKLHVSGGWGRYFGDEGSAYFIAREGIAAALRAADGTGEPTDLLPALLSFAGKKEPRALIEWLYQPETDIAAFSKILSDCAAKGDGIATDILQKAGEQLALLPISLAKSYPVGSLIGVSGSVLKKDKAVRNSFCNSVKAALPNARITDITVSPEVAAANLAEFIYRERILPNEYH